MDAYGRHYNNTNEEEEKQGSTSRRIQGIKEPSKRIRKENIRVLKSWLKHNKDYPYPSFEDVSMLAEKTSLTEKQIRVWFTNYRYNESSTDSKSIAIKETSEHYLSKYFCVCETGITAKLNQSTGLSLKERISKFLKGAGYCTCESTMAKFFDE